MNMIQTFKGYFNYYVKGVLKTDYFFERPQAWVDQRPNVLRAHSENYIGGPVVFDKYKDADHLPVMSQMP